MDTEPFDQNSLPQLTEQQQADILLKARLTMAQQERTRQYLENLKKPQQLPTAEEYFAWLRYEAQREDEQNSRYLGPSGFVLDDENKAIFWALCLYFTHDARFESLHQDNPFFADHKPFSLDKGISLFGPVGCGKTTMGRLFSSNPRESFTVAPCSIIAHQYGDEGDEWIDYYSGRSSMYGSAFSHTSGGRWLDDLGVEPIPITYYGKKINVMATVLDRRYLAGPGGCGKTHMSTNLSAVQIQEYYGERIRSRTREMFNAIYFKTSAQDRRQ